MLPITKNTSTVNTTYLANRKIKYICIHYTAGVTSKAGTAKATANYFKNPAAKASADFIVDDATIVQYNPDIKNRKCWAVGGGKQTMYGASYYQICDNSNSISIEICSSNKTGKVTNVGDKNWYFTNAVLQNAIDLTKYLMKQYGIDAKHVIRHYDVTGKICPGLYGWTKYSGSESAWEAFKKSISGGSVSAPTTEPAKTATATSTKTSYIIRVTASELNVRKGASTSYPVVMTIKKGEAYTIVEVSADGKWGKLKSGVGWISLAYTQKV